MSAAVAVVHFAAWQESERSKAIGCGWSLARLSDPADAVGGDFRLIRNDAAGMGLDAAALCALSAALEAASMAGLVRVYARSDAEYASKVLDGRSRWAQVPPRTPVDVLERVRMQVAGFERFHVDHVAPWTNRIARTIARFASGDLTWDGPGTTLRAV